MESENHDELHETKNHNENAEKQNENIKLCTYFSSLPTLNENIES